jgi:hypothetical protein
VPKTLNLRDLPDDLVRKAKSCAALRGVTLKDFVLAAIQRETESDALVAFSMPLAMSLTQPEVKRSKRRK